MSSGIPIYMNVDITGEALIQLFIIQSYALFLHVLQTFVNHQTNFNKNTMFLLPQKLVK